MTKLLVFITVFVCYSIQAGMVSAQGPPAQPPAGRYQIVSVSAGQQAGVFLVDTATGCTWQLGRNQETNRLTFIEMDIENLHWSWGSGAQQKLAQKIDEAKLPNDQKALLKQEVNKTACGIAPVVLTPPSPPAGKPEAAPTKKR